MNMNWVDLTIIAVFFVGLVGIAIYVKRYNKSIADFLVANRCAGRYLITISGSMAAIGAVSYVAQFEMYYKGGFCASWWNMLALPIGILVMASGWVNYRYRETRAMTVAQFVEIRYSRSLRIFCGILSWVAGVLNIGIFPAVTAKFFMFFCGLPNTFPLFGIEISTFATIMIIELTIALFFTFLGGMIVIMITDFLQGIFSGIAFLVIIGVFISIFDWDQIVSTVGAASENASLINPYKTGGIEGFNMNFFIMTAWLTFYCTGGCQVGQGYVASAKNAHEAKMAGIIGLWRGGIVLALLIMLIPIGAYAFMHCGEFAAQSQSVKDALAAMPTEVAQNQAVVTLVLTKILPHGILGLLAAVMLAAAITTDDTVLHAWGGVFIQDVVLPFRKKSFTPKQHMWLLRGSIFMIAVIIFFFSLLFRQTDFIMMYMWITMAILLAGYGSVIVGGLYWKRGSTLGAWAAMVVGCTLCLGGIVVQQVWEKLVPILTEWFPTWRFLADNPEKFPFDGTRIAFFASICAFSCYIIGSLLNWLVLRRPAFNLERMLHRGKYAIKGEHEAEVTLPSTGIKTLLPDKEYTKWDKVIHFLPPVFIFSWFALFIITAIYHKLWGTSDRFWMGYWAFMVVLTIIIGVGTTVWLSVGGIYDLRTMIRTLRTRARDAFDDGRVVDHHSLADEKMSIPMNNNNDESKTEG